MSSLSSDWLGDPQIEQCSHDERFCLTETLLGISGRTFFQRDKIFSRERVNMVLIITILFAARARYVVTEMEIKTWFLFMRFFVIGCCFVVVCLFVCVRACVRA